jgi:hypothetical protein
VQHRIQPPTRTTRNRRRPAFARSPEHETVG